MISKIIKTDEKLCRGCNKCIFVCPVHANTAEFINDQNKLSIDPSRCIQCGECTLICDHNARDYDDDTEQFFTRLKCGDKISVLVAPAARTNFSDYKRLLGFLRESGVNLLFDVSFGADITTWAYLKAIKENLITSMIAQPCPVIVSYIQQYKSNLISHLAPIHSPAMCAAIYLRKYMRNTDDLAFISPCIGKKIEFSDQNTYGYVKYNVTISKLIKYVHNNNIDLTSYPEVDFNESPCDLGFTFSRPGGLRENVEYYTDGAAWVKQVEGIEEAIQYLDQYENRMRTHRRLPLLVDILNCSNGCNVGTGTERTVQTDDIDYITNRQKDRFLKEKPSAQDSRTFEKFDQMLSLNDFRREYIDNSHNIQAPTLQDIENVFIELGKITPESRNINCFACAYGGCLKFATAVANGNNDVRNCINYSRFRLKNGKNEFDATFQSLEKKITQIDDNLKKIMDSSSNLSKISLQTKIISINARIESVRAGEHGKAFSVVADGIKDLAEKSEQIIGANTDNQDKILNDIRSFEEAINSIKDKIDNILQ